MKTKVLLLSLGLMAYGLQAQTTHNLDWYMGISDANASLTILAGDTVIWTNSDAGMPHTVETTSGPESFDSGNMNPGAVFSYTFNTEGAYDYICGYHPSMNGTITVEENLGIDDVSLAGFKIQKNPAANSLMIELPQNIQSGQITIFDILGKEVTTQAFHQNENLEINITALNQGLYFVTLASEGQKSTKRFIKN